MCQIFQSKLPANKWPTAPSIPPIPSIPSMGLWIGIRFLRLFMDATRYETQNTWKPWNDLKRWQAKHHPCPNLCQEKVNKAARWRGEWQILLFLEWNSSILFKWQQMPHYTPRWKKKLAIWTFRLCHPTSRAWDHQQSSHLPPRPGKDGRMEGYWIPISLF